MYKNKLNIWTAALIILLIAFIAIQSVPIITPLNNVQIKGWLIGRDAQFAGERVWGYSGTLDTLVVTGVDTTCGVYLTPKTATGTLRYDIHSAGDTIFVTSTGSETATTDKYSYLIVRNAYGASD